MRNTYAYSQESPILDAVSPDYSLLIANISNPNRLSRNGQDEGWGGFYFQDQLELPYKLHVLAGFRYDDATNTTWTQDLYFSNPARALQPYTPVSNHDTAVKPRFGVLWQPAKELSLYANYVENFGLSQGHNADNTPLPPVTAEQYEGGIKTELFDGRFTGSLAWFDITKQNLAIADTSPLGLQTGAYRAIGEVRNRGVELDLAGEVLPGWRMIGNYSYIDSRVTRDSDFNGGTGSIGNRLPNVPRNSASFWNTYEFLDTELRGLKFGAGVVLRDQRQGDLNNDLQLPGYATVDLMAGYGIKLGKTKLSTQINAYNILDKHYYESTPGSQSLPAIGYGIMPGAPTTVMGLVRLEF